MRRSRHLALGLIALSLLLWTWQLSAALHQMQGQQAPPGWSSLPNQLPVQLETWLGGALPEEAGRPLEGREILRSEETSASLQAEIWWAESSRLTLRADSPTRRMEWSLGGRGQVSEGPLQGPLLPLACRESQLRSPPLGALSLAASWEGGRWSLALGDQVLECVTRHDYSQSRWELQSGLRRLGLLSLELAEQPGWSASGFRGLRWLLLAAALGLTLALSRLSPAAQWTWALTLSPLMLSPLFGSAATPDFLQRARISPAPGPHWAWAAPLFLSQGAALLVWCRRLTREAPSRALLTTLSAAALSLSLSAELGWTLGILAGAAGGLLVFKLLLGSLSPARGGGLAITALTMIWLLSWAHLMDPRWPRAVTLTGLWGGLLGMLIGVNGFRPRWWNPLSLLLVAGLALLGEYILVWTQYGASVLGQSSREGDQTRGGAYSSFEAIEHRRAWQDYPVQDYPAQPPPDEGRPRIAALGSSSTAGAYQNEQLDEFWPARLQEQLGEDAQVMNLGVGGWTSFHVRRFLETRAEDLAIDVAVLYIGHNDVLTPSPVPLQVQHALWMEGRHQGTEVSKALARVRLYQALRFGLQAGIGIDGLAVPLEHAEENLRGSIELLRQQGAKTLLVLEALDPDPSPMQSYGALMSRLAEESEDVAWLDANDVLVRSAPTGLFLDDCHLTDRGHRVLSGAILEELRALGWQD